MTQQPIPGACRVSFSDVVLRLATALQLPPGHRLPPCKLLRLDPGEKALLIALAFQQA